MSPTLAMRSLWAKKAKPPEMSWLPLVTHLADSAELAKKLWECWVSDGVKKRISNGLHEGGDAKQLLVFLAACHDVGKATPVFQAKGAYPRSDLDERIEEGLLAAGLPMLPFSSFAEPGKTLHAFATQLILERAGCNRNVAAILGAHHGRPADSNMLIHNGIGSYPGNFHLSDEGKIPWTQVQNELIQFALQLAGFSNIQELPCPDMAAQALLSGLLVMVDWLASNEALFPYYQLHDEPDSSVKRARTAWRRIDFPSPWDIRNTWMAQGFFQCRFPFSPNALQRAAVQAAVNVQTPGIMVMEAPMGMGKTEAALAAAEIFAEKSGRSGVLFALPTQATSNGIFPRVLNWMERLEDGVHTIRLAHGKAQFNQTYQQLKAFEGSVGVGEDESGGALVHQWFEGNKKSLLADFVVGTVDQVLLAALKQKYVMLRHLGLANKVVIIDELHAYDAYMSRYLDMALRWLGAYGVPVIMLSATLPAQKRQQVIDAYLNRKTAPKDSICTDPLGRGTPEPVPEQAWVNNWAYPLITYTDGSKVLQEEVAIEPANQKVLLEYLPDDEICSLLEERLSGGGYAGVIVNTVRRAQTLAQALRERFGDEVMLTHARFLAPDRAEQVNALLGELGKSGGDTRLTKRRIVVGTQVLEQSLDIDFDILITDLCPIDLLLQRIGRLHRHERARPDKLVIARCFITGTEGAAYESSAYIYQEYLLLRTKELLPERLVLPRDIPLLVQKAYGDDPGGVDGELVEARRDWEDHIASLHSKAGAFCMWPPSLRAAATIEDWLNSSIGDRYADKHGEAAVRDSDESIEVLLVQRRGGKLCFLPWIAGGGEIPQHDTPDDALAMELARQSVRLPPALCAWMRSKQSEQSPIERTIDALEAEAAANMPRWLESRWLKGCLFLILDEAYEARLCGYRLRYDRRDGLLYEKEDNLDGGKGV